MYCSHCGTQVPDDSVFCENCGANISADAPIKHRKPLSRRTLIIIAAVSAALIIALVVGLIVSNLPTTIEMDGYITVSFAGYDTFGELQMNVNEEKMLEDLQEKMDPESFATLRKAVYNGRVSVQTDKHESLRNGDTVTLKLTVDTETMEELGLKFVLKKTAYTVEGLQSVTTVDPFDYLKVVYSGYEPYASVELESTATEEYLKQNLYFYTYDRTYDLSKNDSITVCVGGASDDVNDHGYSFTRFEMDYVLEDVPQPKPLDIFANLTVKFTGAEGEGRVVYEKNAGDDPFLSGVYYRFDRAADLSTGDVITCTATYYDAPEQFGYTVETTEKTFTVPQLGTYVTDYTTLEEGVRTQLTDKALEILQAYFASEDVSGVLRLDNSFFSTTYSMSDFESYENLRLTHAFTYTYEGWSTVDHMLGLVFALDMQGHPTEAADGTAYCYVTLKNLVLKADGTLEEKWEESITIYHGAYRSFELLQDDRLDYYEDLVVTEQ